MTPKRHHTAAATVSAPVGNTDMDGDGNTDTDDAIYLLYHALLPEPYPLA